MTSLSPDVQRSLTKFREIHSAMANSSSRYFNHRLERLMKFLERDHVVQSVLKPLIEDADPFIALAWLETQSESGSFQQRNWSFPEDQLEELVLRFFLLEYESSGEGDSFIDLLLGNLVVLPHEAIGVFVTVIAEPFYSDLYDMIENASNVRSQDTQAVPAQSEREPPAENESRIFLSHKSEDKPIVKRFESALAELGFSPWLDESEIRTGDEVDRAIDQGMRESCAVVFFVTEHFRDKTYLRDEINYAKRELRKKGKRFKIITLRFSENAVIPDLLDTYRYEFVQNDLDALFHIIRALPIELGPIQWKEDVVE